MSWELEDENEPEIDNNEASVVRMKELNPEVLYYEYRLRLTETPLPCFIVPGVLETPEFEFWEVAYQSQKDIQSGNVRYAICNCKDGVQPVGCVPCHYRHINEWGNLRLRPQRRVALSMLVLRHYHFDAGKVYLCSENCKRCNAGLKRYFGLKRFLVLPSNKWNDLKKSIHDYPNINLSRSDLIVYGVSRKGKDVSMTPMELDLDARRALLKDTRTHHFDPLDLPRFLIFQKQSDQAKRLGFSNPFIRADEILLDRVLVSRIEELYAKVVKHYET